MRTIARQIVFVSLTVLFVVLFLEGSLMLLSLASPAVTKALAPPSTLAWIPDPRLEYRPNPLYADYDRNGFRNVDVPRTADIVALGDSQTYGEGVEPSEAWPRQLELLSGRKVYQIAFGGWGPIHSLLLWDEAISFQPDVVIEGFYAGNDLYNAFHMVYSRGQFPELKTSDRAAQEQIAAQENAQSLEDRVGQLYRELKEHPEQETPANPELSPTSFLVPHSRLYAVVQRVVHEIEELPATRRARATKPEGAEWWRAQRWARERPQACFILDDGSLKTILTPTYRLGAVDLRDARIREGQRISLAVFERMHDLAKERGIRFVVALIPTKELVFASRARDLSRDYTELVEQEQTFRNETIAFLDSRGIEWVDTLPALRAELNAGANPYPFDDGHPNARGQRTIAEAVNRRLAKR